MTKEQEYTVHKESSQENAHIYEATESYQEVELTQGDLEDVLEMLGDCPYLQTESRACVIYGYGCQFKQTFAEIDSLDGVSVLWDSPIVPWFLRPLSLIVPSHGGLIRIDDARQMKDVFCRLASLGMVEMYSFPQVMLAQVLEYVRRRKWKNFIGHMIGRDPTYVCFGSNGDTAFIDTGILGWLSYGEKCPDALKCIASQASGNAQA